MRYIDTYIHTVHTYTALHCTALNCTTLHYTTLNYIHTYIWIWFYEARFLSHVYNYSIDHRPYLFSSHERKLSQESPLLLRNSIVTNGTEKPSIRTQLYREIIKLYRENIKCYGEALAVPFTKLSQTNPKKNYQIIYPDPETINSYRKSIKLY